MAALVYCVCGALNDLYVFTHAFQLCNCDYQRTLKYLRYRKRIRLFSQYLRDFHLEYNRSRSSHHCRQGSSKKTTRYSSSHPTGATSHHYSRGTNIVTGIKPTPNDSEEDEEKKYPIDTYPDSAKTTQRIAMQRAGIDFAAIEASSEAFEAIDSFAIKSQGSISTEDFLQVERMNAEFRENYYYPEDIEIVDGFEDDVSITFYTVILCVFLYSVENNDICLFSTSIVNCPMKEEWWARQGLGGENHKNKYYTFHVLSIKNYFHYV